MRKLRKIIYPLTVVIIIITIIYICIINKKLSSKKYDNIITEDIVLDNEKSQEEIEYCNVDIKGAVSNPGVYSVECTNTVNDVIKLTGGLSKNADTSVINLAKKVSDEMVIIIYTKEEVKNSNIIDTVIKIVDKECTCPNIQNDSCINTDITDNISNQNSSDKININTATIEKLTSLQGVGESKAKAIIEYRNNNGNFKSIEDIKNVSGIGDSLYEQIKDYITT